jgi:hypothetical protein
VEPKNYSDPEAGGTKLSIRNYLLVDMKLCTRVFGSPRILVFNLTNISDIFMGIMK